MDLSPLIPFLFEHFGEAFLFIVFIGWPLLQSILAARAKKEGRTRSPRRERAAGRGASPESGGRRRGGAPAEGRFDGLAEALPEAPADPPSDLFGDVPEFEDDASPTQPPSPTGKEMWKELLEGLGVPEEALESPAPASEPVRAEATSVPEHRPAPATLAEDFPVFEASTLGQSSAAAHLSTSLGELPGWSTDLGDLGDLGGLGDLGELGDLAVDLPSEIRGAPDAPHAPHAHATVPGAERRSGGTPFERPRGPEDWRRAVILSEVLGPPLSEREPGSGAAPGLGF